jgi:hypothetical protein
VLVDRNKKKRASGMVILKQNDRQAGNTAGSQEIHQAGRKYSRQAGNISGRQEIQQAVSKYSMQAGNTAGRQEVKQAGRKYSMQAGAHTLGKNTKLQ